jgi:hypothetical protein
VLIRNDTPARGARVARRLGAVAILAFLAFPALGCGPDADDPAARAQAQAADIPEDATPEELMAELQEINQELQRIQEQAMAKPELQERRAAVEDKLVAEMRDVDPDIEAKMERAETIEAEVLAAREEGAGDEEMHGLLAEYQQLHASLQATQEQAAQREAVTDEMDAFRDELVAEMTEVDPRAEQLIARAEAIIVRLQQQMEQQPGMEQAPVDEDAPAREDAPAPQE